MKRFSAAVLGGHKGAAVEVPFDPAEAWGTTPVSVGPRRRGHPVDAVINGIAFAGAVVPRSGKHWLLLDSHVLAATGLAEGDVAEVAMKTAAPGAAVKEKKAKKA